MRTSLLWSYLRMYVWCAYTWDLMHDLAMRGLAMHGLAWFYSRLVLFSWPVFCQIFMCFSRVHGSSFVVKVVSLYRFFIILILMWLLLYNFQEIF